MHSALILSGWMFTSLVQVYYVALAVRVVLDAIKKTKYKFDWLAVLIAIWFTATAVLYQKSFSSGVIFMIKNCAVVLYILLFLKANRSREKALGGLLSVVAIFVFFAGVYALTRSIYWDNRLCSTIHDPNYSAMFYGMGIFASFGATLFKKWLRISLSFALSGMLLFTMSLTGIFFNRNHFDYILLGNQRD